MNMENKLIATRYCLDNESANYYQREEDLKNIPEFTITVSTDMNTQESPQGQILRLASQLNLPYEEISDGYHTFKELYEFRKVYNAALFNEWAENYMNNLEMMKKGIRMLHNPLPKYDVHKSWRHYDGELCFGGDWFIVVAMLPTGQISNHYHKDDWDLFRIPEVEKAKYPFDGHTPKDVLERLKNLT